MRGAEIIGSIKLNKTAALFSARGDAGFKINGDGYRCPLHDGSSRSNG